MEYRNIFSSCGNFEMFEKLVIIWKINVSYKKYLFPFFSIKFLEVETPVKQTKLSLPSSREYNTNIPQCYGYLFPFRVKYGGVDAEIISSLKIVLESGVNSIFPFCFHFIQNWWVSSFSYCNFFLKQNVFKTDTPYSTPSNFQLSTKF